MNHWIIAPVILPALLAPLIAFVMRHDIVVARAASAIGTLALLAISIGLTVLAAKGETHVYYLGNWPAPFGIVLVLDRLSALMVLLTAILAVIVLLHAMITEWDNRGRHFHALFQFQLMGICGAFLTGDAFNLFVFFEVLLIASYGLMVHSGGKTRLQAGLQYVVMNLVGSTLFLFALGTLYAATGTLNIADLVVKVQESSADDSGLIRVAAMLLLIVFGIKAALVPLHFWLPATYANAPAPVAALFAIMTKVGAYAIIRIHGMAFGPDNPATDTLIGDWLFPLALLTIALGAVGVLGARRVGPLLSYAVVGSMGTLLLAVSVFDPYATTTALYYLIHSTFSAAALFLLADLIVARRGNDWLGLQPATMHNGLFAALFFVAAIGMVGMPPLSGFLGKLMILDALSAPEVIGWAWTAILVASLLSILGFARAGSILFWKSTSASMSTADVSNTAAAQDHRSAPIPAVGFDVAPAMLAVALLVALAATAGPVTSYLEATSAQIYESSGYVDAVLNGASEEAR